jgi:CubicO group peptidase (beta-lactamase class C family)
MLGAVALAAVSLALPMDVLGPEYVRRIVLWGNSSVADIDHFPARRIAAPGIPFRFVDAPDEPRVAAAFRHAIAREPGAEQGQADFRAFLARNDTTGFIVAKGDRLLYEGYFNGRRRDSWQTSFSMAKSFVSTLVGIAIADGRIESVDQPIVDFLPELDRETFAHVTIRHLLRMSSGFAYDRSKILGLVDSPWGDDAKIYYSPRLRALALRIEPERPPLHRFQYDNYHPLLLGLILERATGMPVSAYLEEKIWSPLGMEFPASWSLDSEADGLEKLESGLNARTIDFAKFGLLMLRRGVWNGRQLVPRDWIEQATTPPADTPEDYYHHDLFADDPFFRSDGGFYGFMWWGYAPRGGRRDFFAFGRYGQFIYVVPEKDLVIVRNGTSDGCVTFWPALLRRLADAM